MHHKIFQDRLCFLNAILTRQPEIQYLVTRGQIFVIILETNDQNIIIILDNNMRYVISTGLQSLAYPGICIGGGFQKI
jgi:hypothetical protein